MLRIPTYNVPQDGGSLGGTMPPKEHIPFPYIDTPTDNCRQGHDPCLRGNEATVGTHICVCHVIRGISRATNIWRIVFPSQHAKRFFFRDQTLWKIANVSNAEIE